MSTTTSTTSTTRRSTAAPDWARGAIADRFPFQSVADIRHANADAGRHYFSPDTMRFFSSRALEGVYTGTNGQFFVTSEHNFDRTARLYSVRCAMPSGHVDTVGGFQGYTTRAAAVAAARYSAGDPSTRHQLTVRRGGVVWVLTTQRVGARVVGRATAASVPDSVAWHALGRPEHAPTARQWRRAYRLAAPSGGSRLVQRGGHQPYRVRVWLTMP